jgi:hypothetical protein
MTAFYLTTRSSTSSSYATPVDATEGHGVAMIDN